MKKTLSILLSLTLLLGLFAPAALGEGEPEKMIRMVLPSLDGAYWLPISEGAAQAADDLDVDIMMGSTEGDIKSQIAHLQEVAAQSSVLIVGADDIEAMADAIMEIYETGLPVILVDSYPAGDAFSAAFVTDNTAAGQAAAEQMLAMFKETGVPEAEENLIAIQMDFEGVEAIDDRINGFITYWKENAPESWKVLEDDMKVNQGESPAAIGITQELLGAYENLKGVYAPDAGSTVGFATGLTEMGRSDIIMVGFDLGAEMEEMIRSNQFVVASVVQRQYIMGYEAITAALAFAGGEILEEQDKCVDTGVVIVTSQNIDSAAVAEALGQ